MSVVIGQRQDIEEAFVVQTTSRGSQSVPAIVIGLDCITGVQTARLGAAQINSTP